MGNKQHKSQIENTVKKNEVCCTFCNRNLENTSCITPDYYTISIPNKMTAICKACDIKRGETFANIQKYEYKPYQAGTYGFDKTMIDKCELCPLSKEYRRHITYANIKVCKPCYDHYHARATAEKFYRRNPMEKCEVCKTNTPYEGKYTLVDCKASLICGFCAILMGANDENLKNCIYNGKCSNCQSNEYLVCWTWTYTRIDMCQACWINYNKV